MTTAIAAATAELAATMKKKPENKNISYLPGVVALAAADAVAVTVELSGLHNSKHVFVAYFQGIYTAFYTIMR